MKIRFLTDVKKIVTVGSIEDAKRVIFARHPKARISDLWEHNGHKGCKKRIFNGSTTVGELCDD